MSKIKESICKMERHLFAFVTCGDPDLETTAKVVRAADGSKWCGSDRAWDSIL